MTTADRGQNMPTITFIFGLCASGKSWLSKEMANEGSEVLDEGFPATADGSLSPEKYATLQEFLREGKDCAVVEATLFYEPLQQQALKYLEGIPNVDVKWIGYQNDPETANHNAFHRKGKVNPNGNGHKVINDRWSQLPWTIPADAEIKTIYKLPCEDGAACPVCHPKTSEPRSQKPPESP
jgi:hypothetical protein